MYDLKPSPVEIYKNKQGIGSGTFGNVFKANVGDNMDKWFALKYLKPTENEAETGFPIIAMREIKLLKQLKHQNIVNMVDIATNHENKIWLVFEYASHDLQGLLEAGVEMDKS